MRKAIVTLCMVGTVLGCATSCQSTKQPNTTQQTTQAQVALTEIHSAVKEAYGENYLPQMAYDAELFEALFGISSDLYL